MAEQPSVNLQQHFATLEDPRIDRTKRHALLDIVTIALCGVICGAESWVEIEQFGLAKERCLRTFLALPNGIPSHDTFGRVFAALDPAQFEQCFLGWSQALAAQTAQQVVAVDGKTLRRSHDRPNGKAALQLISAWASANHLLLGQVAVADDTNETAMLPQLLTMLALEGAIVTIDAAGCQPAIAQQIREQGGDYVLALKENQPTLWSEVAQVFAEAQARDFAGILHDHQRTVEKGHGRVEIREVWTLQDPDYLAWLDEQAAWIGLRSIGMVTAERWRGAEVTRETRYYLSSLSGEAAEYARAVRAHWGIENQLHWLLDVAFREDDCRVRQGHAAQNFAVLRRLALHLLRRDRSTPIGIKAKRLKAGWDETYLLHVLAG